LLPFDQENITAMPIIHLPKLYFIVFPLFLMLAFAGCKKENKTSISYDFSWSGSPYVGNTIHFTTTPSSGSKFAWDFGDKNTAAAANPDHIYSVSTSFTVTLMVNDDTAHTIRKTIKIGFDSTLMSTLAGSRLYHHKATSHREMPGGGDSVTVTTYPDITMSILNIDPATILFGSDSGSDSLNYSTTSSGIVTFSYVYYYNTVGIATGTTNTLTFYTTTNKVHYLHHNMDGVFNYTDVEYDTP
jgi:PKD domain-containing protein